MKKIVVRKDSSFSVEGGMAIIDVCLGEKKILEHRKECIPGKDVGVPYPHLNPLQTAFLESFAGENTLVCSPTSSGKSLIAKLFMDRFKGRKVYIAPTRSLVREKYAELKRFYGKVDIRTGEAIEDFRPVTAPVVVATYDALVLSLRNRASWTRSISTAVFDEIHQIFREDTGWSVDESLFYLRRRGARVLGLSATVYEPEKLAEYIGAKLLILSEWRPTKLIKHDPERLPADRKGKEDASTRTAMRLLEAVRKNSRPHEKVIVFTTKKVGWKALELVNMLWEYNIVNESVPFDVVEHRNPRGKVAFHNADISTEERGEIEHEFRKGDLNLLFATSTLAYGVNTPADKVMVLVTPLREGKIYPGALDIIQMEGRAGRFGIKDRGEVFTFVSWIKEDTFLERFERDLGKNFEESMSSRRTDAGLLVLIAVMHEGKDYEKFLKNFRFNVSPDNINRAVKLLREKGYMNGFTLTHKGRFCVASSLPPESLEEFMERLSKQPNLDGLEDVYICRPLIKGSFSGVVGFFEQFGISEDLRYFSLKYLKKEATYDLSEVLLFYVNGELLKYKKVNRPPSGLELRTEAMYVLRSLAHLKKEGIIKWSDEKILKTVHSIAFGLPPAQSPVGSIPGMGAVRATALARAMRRVGTRAEIGMKVEDLIRELDTFSDFQEALREEFKYRYEKSKELDGALKSIRTILEREQDFLLGDEKILRLWAGFTKGPAFLTKSKGELLRILRSSGEEKI